MSTQQNVGDEFVHMCTKCKLRLTHFVTVSMNGVALKVQCKTCKKHGKFVPEKQKWAAKEKKTSVKALSKSRAARKALTLDWDELKTQEPKNYSIREIFEVNDVIFHSKFSLGVVLKTNGNVLDVEFENAGIKQLVHNK